MPDLYEVAESHREALLRRDRATTRALIDAYGKAWSEIRRHVRRLTDQLRAEREAGREVPVSWLHERGRLLLLEAQVRAEVDRLARALDSTLANEQRDMIGLAQEHAALQVAAADVPSVAVAFTVLPTDAVSTIAGFTANGSPLRALLDELGPDASGRVRDALINGVATGQGVRDIARAARQALAGNMARAMVISRTEVLRSYREAAHRQRLDNAHLLRGWVWLAALSPRTCPSCLAQHGSVHPLRERLAEHPAGRCVAVPLVRGDDFSVPPGVEWFDRQDARTKALVLGNGGAAAYEAGAVTLDDFVGTKRSRDWGTSTYARSLKQIVGPEEARRWARVAAQAA